MQLHNASGAGTNASLYLTGSDAQAARLAAGGACTTISFRTGAAHVVLHVCVQDWAGFRGGSWTTQLSPCTPASAVFCLHSPLHTSLHLQRCKGPLPVRKLATWAQCRGVSLGACSLRHEPTRQRRWLGRPPCGGTMQACAPFRGRLLHGRNAADARGCPPAFVQRAGRPHGPAVAHTARGNPQSEAYSCPLATHPISQCIVAMRGTALCCLSAVVCCCREDTSPCQGAFLPPAVPAPLLDTERGVEQSCACFPCILHFFTAFGRRARGSRFPNRAFLKQHSQCPL